MKSSAQILIIDKTGLIGEPLFSKLSKEFKTVFVSNWRKFPAIPDNNYSHIILIDDGEEELEFLPKIIDKAKDINSDFIFAKRLSSNEEHIVRKVLNLYSSAKVALYGDVFDNKLIPTNENFKSVINKYIYQAQRFGKIQIPGDGLKNTYPVFIDDVVQGLVDLVFGIHKSHSLFYIFPKHPVTELSLSHMIQKANPEIAIDFVRLNLKKETISYPPKGKYLLEDKYPLAKKVRTINIRRVIKREEGKSSKDLHRKAKHFPGFILWMLIFLIFSPLVFTLIFSFLGLGTLYFAKTEIEKGKFGNAKNAFVLSQTLFSAGKKTSNVLVSQANIIGRKHSLKRLLDDIDLGDRVSLVLSQGLSSVSYFSKVFNGQSKSPLEDFAKGQNDLKSAIVEFKKIEAEGKIPAQFIQNTKNISPLIKVVSNTSDVMANIFGFDGEKKYLVLFQNNMELRPGGGFIGSYGILSLDMGRIKDFSIHDVYDADGQLRGHVEPPFAIRRHLSSAHWYLRDSNFDVDFSKSASSSSNFLFAETGQKVDGVIGVDVSFIKNILKATGPVNVLDYKETVTENNLFELTEAHSEKNFFPGSTQKKDFLRSLYKALQNKVSANNISYLALAQAVSDSLAQKHLIFTMNDNMQNIFTVNGLSSSLWDEREGNKNSINDFLGINEANLGVNKVNYFINRSMSQKVSIDSDGKISEELIISYKNTSSGWPGGDYKNYLRIILPLDAEITDVSINDKNQILVDAIVDPLIYEAKDFKAPDGLEVEKTVEENKTIYGFIVNVPAGEIVKVKVEYSLAKKIPESNSFSYSLKLFKQPGIDVLPYSFYIAFPNNFSIINGKMFHAENIVSDKTLIVDFAKR
ncbi:MAG: DUF4012 domain-containing protein [bacterium]|nr:DUF4012 domain-containing protein [bacterium]